MSAAKIGRNDPCSCGSGKKYKQCCAAKAEQREQVTGSLFKGAFLAFPFVAAASIVGLIVYSLAGAPAGDDGLERVWNAAHNHYHVVLPDGTETEIQPGMVWHEEHGHFHRVAAPTDAMRSHTTSALDQRLEDAERRLDAN